MREKEQLRELAVEGTGESRNKDKRNKDTSKLLGKLSLLLKSEKPTFALIQLSIFSNLSFRALKSLNLVTDTCHR